MSTEYLDRVVRDGRNVMRFKGRVLGSETSKRTASPRWSELTVYALADPTAGYIRSKIGRSLVVHEPDCLKVRHWMTSWIDLKDKTEQAIVRTPCIECQPNLSHGMDPQLIAEATHYTATVASLPEVLLAMLMEGRPGDRAFTLSSAPYLIRSVIAQVRDNDPAFAELLVRHGYAVPVVNRPLEHRQDGGWRRPGKDPASLVQRQS